MSWDKLIKINFREFLGQIFRFFLKIGSLVPARRGFEVRRHTTPRLESPSWQTTDYMDESGRAGHRTHCCWRMGYRWRPVNLEGATTHSRLRAAVSEWVEVMQVMLCIWESKHTSGRHHRDRRISDILTYASYGFSNFWDGCKHPTCTPVVLHRYPFYSAGTSVRLRSQWYVYQLWVIHTSETCTRRH